MSLEGQAQSYWDRNVGRHRQPFAHHEGVPEFWRAIALRVTGDLTGNPFLWAYDKYGPFQDVVDLGCGDGALASALASHDPQARVIGYDFSLGSLARAAKSAAAYRTARSSSWT